MCCKTERDRNLWKCYQTNMRAQHIFITHSRIWDIFANIWEIMPWADWQAIKSLSFKRSSFCRIPANWGENPPSFQFTVENHELASLIKQRRSSCCNSPYTEIIELLCLRWHLVTCRYVATMCSRLGLSSVPENEAVVLRKKANTRSQCTAGMQNADRSPGWQTDSVETWIHSPLGTKKGTCRKQLMLMEVVTAWL